MDTPGVLARDELEHNAMEKLTLGAIEHVDSIVVFVMDLSGKSHICMYVCTYVRTYIHVFFWCERTYIQTEIA